MVVVAAIIFSLFVVDIVAVAALVVLRWCCCGFRCFRYC